MQPTDAVDRDRLVRVLLELVAIDSPTGHEEAIGKEPESRFTELGCAATRDEIGNLVAVLPGTRDETVLLATHMNTAGSDTGIRPLVDDDGISRTDGSTILGADDKSGPARPAADGQKPDAWRRDQTREMSNPSTNATADAWKVR